MLLPQARPLFERPAGFIGELANVLTSGGPEDIRWGTIPGGAALGPLSQVRNLERIFRATSRMGAPTIRSSVRGVHPERYMVEFLDPKTLGAGRVVAPMDDWKSLLYSLPAEGTGKSGVPGIAPPHAVLAMIRALLQGAPRR